MDKKKSRDPKDTIGFLKEWVSDNLRYILLAAAIIIIVLIIIFALSSSPIEKGGNQSPEPTKAVSETSTPAENGLATEDKSAGASEDKSALAEDKSDVSAVDGSSAAEDTSAASAEDKSEETVPDANAGSSEDGTGETQEQTSTGSQLTVAAPEISATVETYLSALAASDVDSAASVSENLTDVEIAAITQGAYPSPIERIVVYAYPGAEEGTYVAIARFDATDRASLVSIPACSAYYLITADTGAVLMASADTTAAHQAEIDAVLGYPAVEQLIADVSNAAQAVMASVQQ